MFFEALCYMEEARHLPKAKRNNTFVMKAVVFELENERVWLHLLRIQASKKMLELDYQK